MKRLVKKIIDVIILVLFIILMGYHITGEEVHEILGSITFVFFIVHNLLNIRWYKTIFRGKITFYKVFQVTVNLLLLASMFGMMLSAIMISGYVFDFLNIKTTMFGRSLHMLSTSWGFIFMSIHVGLHLNVLLFKINRKMKESAFEYIYYLIIFMLMLYGLYTFVNSGVWKDMLLITKFKFFDYSQNPVIFYLGQFSILCFISFLIYILLNIKIRHNVKKQK